MHHMTVFRWLFQGIRILKMQTGLKITKNTPCLLSTYIVPGTVQMALFSLVDLIFIIF